MYIKLKQKYLETTNHEAVTLAVQTGVLSCIFSLLHALLKPESLFFIVALIGVLVMGLLQTIALRGPINRRLRYTFGASLIIGITTGIGSYCGTSFFITSLGLLILIPLVAYSSSSDHLIASTILFSADLFIVGSGMPASGGIAFSYALAFMFGGLATWLLAYIWNRLHPSRDKYAVGFKKLSFSRIFANYHKQHRFALVLTFAVIIGNAISYLFHLPQGYWVPMTAMLILKSDFDFAKKRINHRLYGTLLGSILAFIIIMLVSSKIYLALLMLPLMFLMVIALAKHYGAYTFFLTIAVTVMMNLIEPEGYLITKHRIIDTVLGVLAVFLVIWFIKPRLKNDET